jgi:REP element-mobilizing transposase RayT
MANTYTSLYYHIVFSTKFRFPWLTLEVEQRVWSAIADVARAHKMTPVQIGGVEDHVHALVMAPPIVAPFELAKWLKGESSLWIHEEFPGITGLVGRMVMPLSQSANQKWLTSFAISRISATFIQSKHFRKSIWNFCD